MLTFAPDAIDIAPERLSAVSAVPTMRGYATPPAGVDMGGAQFSDTATGAALLLGLSGTTRTIVGSSTKLWEYASGSWTDRSRAVGGAYTGTSRWRFAAFGDTELAINKAVVLQESSTGAFSNVSNAPKAGCMEVVSGFVMLADTDDSGLSITGGPNANQGHRWWCSQLFGPTSTWAPSPSTQATTGLLVETPGAIKQLKRLNNDCVAYKPRSIYVGRYVGGAAVWQWQCVSTDTGTDAPDSVASVGGRHFFIGDSDFYAFDGASVVPIGALIKDWFFARLNRSWISEIRVLHDRNAKFIYWFYPSGSGATLNSVVVYHYDTQRWGAFDLTISEVLETVTDTITYDSLGNLYSTYDAAPNIPYDSPFWSANAPVLAYLSSTGYLNSLTGAASSMTMTTGYHGDEGVVSLCSRVRPRFRLSPTAATCVPHHLMQLGDSPTVSATTATMHDGRFDVLQAARYHRFAMTFDGSCEVEAVTPTLVQQGVE